MPLYVHLLVLIVGIGTMGMLCFQSKELFWITEQKLNSIQKQFSPYCSHIEVAFHKVQYTVSVFSHI